MQTRVRRLRPPRSRAGTGPVSAASISRRVTRSQWQTMSLSPGFSQSRSRGSARVGNGGPSKRAGGARAGREGPGGGGVGKEGPEPVKHMGRETERRRQSGRANPAHRKVAGVRLQVQAVFLFFA